MNLKTIPLKKWIDFIVVFFIGLITLLALVFPLQKGGDTVYGIYKYQECGFDLFDFNSIARPESLEWLTIIAAVLCIIQLLGSIFVMIFAFLNLTSNNLRKYITPLCLTCIVFCFVYGIMGIVLNVIYLSNANGLWLDDFGYFDVNREYISVYTLSYIPFILVLIIYGLYLLIRKNLSGSKIISEQKVSNTKYTNMYMGENQNIIEEKLQPNKENKVNQMYGPQEGVTRQLKESIEGLNSYKELLDSGVITQQEFDEIKKRILKL